MQGGRHFMAFPSAHLPVIVSLLSRAVLLFMSYGGKLLLFVRRGESVNRKPDSFLHSFLH
jgi:hypothetical protein